MERAVRVIYVMFKFVRGGKSVREGARSHNQGASSFAGGVQAGRSTHLLPFLKPAMHMLTKMGFIFVRRWCMRRAM